MASTIDPTQVDPTLPATGEASTATERAQRQVVQDQFGNAVTDIEALQASVAEALVAGDFTAKADILSGTGIGTYMAHPASPDGYLIGYDAATGTGLKGIDPATVGTTDHAVLTNRDAADQHPIGAVTGLQTALDAKMTIANYDASADGVVDSAASLGFVGTNATGAPLGAGVLVQFDSGGNVTQVANASTGVFAYAITSEAIGTGATGRLVTAGIALNVNTVGFSVQDTIYCGDNGAISATEVGDPYQVVGVVLAVGASGAIWYDTQEPTAFEADGAIGILTLTDVAGSFTHNGLATWSEVVPGAGETVLVGSENVSIGANPGRLQLDFSGSSKPPADGTIDGDVVIHLSATIVSAASDLDVSFGINGALQTADIRGTIGGGGNQVAGTIIPITLTVPVRGRSDGDEFSIFTRGSVDAWVMEAFSVQFIAASVATTGSGGGGTSDHQQLTNRSATGAHPATAVSVTPAGQIGSVNAQLALEELDTEKADKAVPAAAGNVATLAANGNLQDGGGKAALGPGTSVAGDLAAFSGTDGVTLRTSLTESLVVTDQNYPVTTTWSFAEGQVFTDGQFLRASGATTAGHQYQDSASQLKGLVAWAGASGQFLIQGIGVPISIGSAVAMADAAGITGTGTVVSGPNWIPNFSAQYIPVIASDLTVEDPAQDGCTVCLVQSGVTTVNFSVGWTVYGAKPSGDSLLSLLQVGTRQVAVWCDA